MANGEREATLLRVYVRDSEQWQGKPLRTAIVEEARRQGLAGATVLRAVEGYGLRHVDAAAPPEAGDLPLVIEVIDWEEKAQPFLKTIDEMVTEGLITTQRVQVVAYRSRAG
jgi:hypothetical protein